MKGNHNKKLNRKNLTFVVFNMSKIQNERKSQQLVAGSEFQFGCVQHVKDTK